ncbi:hypothetical protein QBC35DRAFT_389059 [Podospora australis]|uniref:Uncharacterized protein n=1 Tax=Podospora australis TaxID=1536484 RepID=A0AAN7AGC3_9PEZI|nr:hypothetical protein QBC35DRAFT_389059 [Podospora australis]
MVDHKSSSRVVGVVEVLVETFILALKGLIPMLWLRSKVSPLQFLVGGVVLLSAILLVGQSSRKRSTESSSVKGILVTSRRNPKPSSRRVVFDATARDPPVTRTRYSDCDVCGPGGIM